VDPDLAFWPSMKRDAENRSFLGRDAATIPPPGDRSGVDPGRRLALLQNRPNPFRAGAGTWIPLQVAFDAGAGRPGAEATGGGSLLLAVWPQIEIYDTQGRLLRRLATEIAGAEGARRPGAVWDGRDAQGCPVPSGCYLCRLASGGQAGRVVIQVVR
jgi:hypothetical protein